MIQEKLALFREKGFVHIPNVLAQDEISELITATECMLNDPLHRKDLLTIDDSMNTHKILYPLNKNPALLRYIVHPVILDVLLNMISDPSQIVLTWEDILIKIPYNGIPVTYHQDLALQSTKHDIFSFGLYFHDSHTNPVYYLPESFQYGPLTRDKLYEIAEQRKGEFVPLLVNAGDIAMHNVKTIHYSDPNNTPQTRYTWYLEYRTIDQLREDSPWDEEWIQQRRAIFVAALMRYAPSYLPKLAPDLEKLEPYLRELELRVPHVNDIVKYDMESPYNHFT